MLLEILGFIVCSVYFFKKSLQDIKYVMAYLLVVSILFSPLLRVINFGGVRLAGLYALALVILYIFLTFLNRQKLKFINQDKILVFFSVYVVFSLSMSLYANSFASALVDFSWFFWFFSIVYMILINNKDQSFYSFITKIIYVSGIVLTLIGVYRFLTGQGFVNTTGDLLYIAGSKAVIVGLAFIIALYGNVKYRKYTLVLLIFGLLLSLKRQVYLGLGTALIFNYLVFNNFSLKKILVKGTRVVVLLLIFLVIISFLNIGLLQGLLGKFGSGSISGILNDPAVMYRLASYQRAVSGIIENPLVGQGWGSSFEFRLVLPNGQTQYFDHSPHNTFLWMTYKAGVPMLISYFILLVYPIWRLIHLRNRILSKKRYKVIFGMLILISFGSLFWDYHSVMFLSVPFWFIWSIAYQSVTRFKSIDKVVLWPK